MKILIVINEKPGTGERAYHALRIAGQLLKEGHSVFVYLIADGVFCAMAKAPGPQGISNVSEKVAAFIRNGGVIKMCTSCGESRGLMDKERINGTEWTDLKTLTGWITGCDRIINY